MLFYKCSYIMYPHRRFTAIHIIFSVVVAHYCAACKHKLRDLSQLLIAYVST